jgi:hypothetical protein
LIDLLGNPFQPFFGAISPGVLGAESRFQFRDAVFGRPQLHGETMRRTERLLGILLGDRRGLLK